MGANDGEPKSAAEAHSSRTAALEARIVELQAIDDGEMVRMEDERDAWIAHARVLEEKLKEANELIKLGYEACDIMGGATNNMEQVKIPDEPE